MNNFRGGFGGGFGGANLQNLMRQAQKMQEDMQRAKEELENSEFTASVGGGMVTVVMTGDRKVKDLTIKPQVVDADDIETLQDLIVAGVNDALAQIEEREKETVPQVPGM
ncbi:MAG: YbaB/EbfC family nucleoid-associated protein [Clostridiales bacterium]|nr:YbaB/EbfC family nucleoid-associated protein [Clostridiales bacterium]